MTKVHFRGLRREGASWPPVDVETLWAIPCGEAFRLQNVPFFVRGIAFGDEVATHKSLDGLEIFDRVLHRSGHSTIRILFDEIELKRLRDILSILNGLGATYEKGKENLWALDISDPRRLQSIQEILALLADKGELDYEEGHLAAWP